MSASFADLVRIYRASEPQKGTDARDFVISSEQELALLNALSEKYYEETNLEILTDNLSVSQKVTVQFNQPKPSFGRIYEDRIAFVRGDMAQIHSQHIQKSPYFIKSEGIASTDDTLNCDVF